MSAGLLGLALALPAGADILFLNSGEELRGRARVESGRVLLESGGKTLSYPREQVLRLRLVREWRVPGEDEASRIADPELKALLAAPPSPADYPDDGQLNQRQEQHCELEADGRSRCERRSVQLLLRERSKDRAGNPKLYYVDGLETSTLRYARAINGGTISYLDDSSVQLGSEYSYYPGYDRLKSFKFSIPDVSTGTVIDYAWRDEWRSTPTFPFRLTRALRGYEPYGRVRLSVVAPKGAALEHRVVRAPAGLRFSKEDLGDRVRLSWELADAPSLREENGMPPFWRHVPRVAVAPRRSWEQVAAGVFPAIERAAEAGPALKAKAAELVRGRRTPEAKIEAIYNWVAREIKYQHVGMSDYSYEPKPADAVLEARTGNALDKPFLLYVMLREAGLRPSLVYLESKYDDADFDESLPSLRQFSVAAPVAELGGKTVFLTPFDDDFRWSDNPGWVQGVSGLVVHGARKAGTLLRNPLRAPEKESERHRARLALSEDGAIEAETEIIPVGGREAAWRGFKDLKKADLDVEIEKIVHGVHPSARLLSYAIDGLESPEKPLRVRLRYTVKEWAITAGGSFMAFRVPWVQRDASDVGAARRETPLFWWSREHNAKEVSVSLPPGWSLYHAPEPVDMKSPGGSYRASYSRSPGRLIFRERFTREEGVAAVDYPAYKAYREKMARFTESWIVLRKE